MLADSRSVTIVAIRPRASPSHASSSAPGITQPLVDTAISTVEGSHSIPRGMVRHAVAGMAITARSTPLERPQRTHVMPLVCTRYINQPDTAD